MNATEITQFFLKRKGRCFEGWSEEKIFNYVLVNLVHGNVFVARAPGEGSGSATGDQPTGPIVFAAIAWLNDAERIVGNERMGLPQYDWNRFPSDGDSILIADVAGDRSLMPEILVAAPHAIAKPGIFQKRLFTYRRGKLVELSWKTVLRFSGLSSFAEPKPLAGDGPARKNDSIEKENHRNDPGKPPASGHTAVNQHRGEGKEEQSEDTRQHAEERARSDFGMAGYAHGKLYSAFVYPSRSEGVQTSQRLLTSSPT